MGYSIQNGRVVEDVIPPQAEFFEHARKVGIGKFEPTVYVKVTARGVRDFTSRRATDEDKETFAPAWERFQAGIIETESAGTPLGQLPANKAAFELELKAAGITTVEQLAGISQPEDYLIPMWKQAKLFIQLVDIDEG